MTEAVVVGADAVRLPTSQGGAVLISSSAVGEFALDGTEHRLLSDFVSEGELAARQESYWHAQVSWIRDLERFWVERSPSLQRSGLRPGWALGYPLKLLLDPLYVRAFQADSLSRGGWTGITHLPGAADRLFAATLDQLCAVHDVAYRPQVGDATTAGRPVGRARDIAGRAFQLARTSRLGRAQRGHALRGRMLLLATSYDLGPLARSNAAAGGENFVISGHDLWRLTGHGPHRELALRCPTPEEQQEWQAIAAAVRSSSELAAWPTTWFDGAVASLVMERLAAWTAEALPRVVARAAALKPFLDDDRVDVMVAPFLTTPEDAGSFAGARAAENGPRTMIVEHGETVFYSPSLDFELLAADLLAVPSEELAGHFRTRAAQYPERCASLLVGSYRWRQSAQRAEGRRRPPRVLIPGGLTHLLGSHGGFDRDKPVLVYLMTAMAGDLRYLNNAWYPDEWLFRLEQTIIRALANHPEFNVVVKLFPGGGNAEDPIARYVAGLGAEHVMTSTAPFSHWLPWADRVVADLASTGLYEALLAGRPTLGLVWRHHAVREGAREILGDVLVDFESFDDAAAAVEAFASTRQPPVVRLSPEGSDLLAATLAAV